MNNNNNANTKNGPLLYALEQHLLKINTFLEDYFEVMERLLYYFL